MSEQDRNLPKILAMKIPERLSEDKDLMIQREIEELYRQIKS